MNDTMWSFVDYTCRFAWSVMRGICCNIHEHRCVSHGLPLQCGTLCFNAAELLQFFELVHLMKMVGGKLSVRKVVSASPPRAQAPTSLLTCRNRLAARLGSPWRVGVARGCSAQHVATGRLVSQLTTGRCQVHDIFIQSVVTPLDDARVLYPPSSAPGLLTEDRTPVLWDWLAQIGTRPVAPPTGRLVGLRRARPVYSPLPATYASRRT